MTITLEINMINRQIIPFSCHIVFELYPLPDFISANQDFQNSTPWDPVFALCSGL